MASQQRPNYINRYKPKALQKTKTSLFGKSGAELSGQTRVKAENTIKSSLQ